MPTGRLSRHDALIQLRSCLEDGIVEPHPHFLKALADDNLSLTDAWIVLRGGTIYDEPEFDVRFQQWRYKVEGKETGGKWLKIVFTFLQEDETTVTLLITAFVSQK